MPNVDDLPLDVNCSTCKHSTPLHDADGVWLKCRHPVRRMWTRPGVGSILETSEMWENSVHKRHYCMLHKRRT